MAEKKKTSTRRTRVKKTVAAAKPAVKSAAKPAAKKTTGAKRGRKPGSSSVNVEGKKKLNPLYNQFTALLKRRKVSKLDLASRISMSYQGFLNSYNNKNIKLETWHEIADELGMVFTAKFESAKSAAKNAEEIENQEVHASVAPAAVPVGSSASDDFTQLKLGNAQEKIQILERQINSLESQLKDKQTIIELLQERK